MTVTPDQAWTLADLSRRLGTLEVNFIHGNHEILRVDIEGLLPRLIHTNGTIDILGEND